MLVAGVAFCIGVLSGLAVALGILLHAIGHGP
jgi:hypothetical protein